MPTRFGTPCTRGSSGTRSRKTARPPTALKAPCETGPSGSGSGRRHLFDLREVVEDDDNVVVLVHITARGRASGLEVEFRFYAQFTLRDGKVIRIYDHEEREAALEAAGLTG